MIAESIKNLIWGFPTVLIITAFGAYFTFKSRLYLPKNIFAAFKTVFSSFKKSKTNGISPFAAAATALGGTVGVGSIVGVGYGIAVGGAGSVFWMWVCSFFGMGLKYAEVRISLKDRLRSGSENYGGAPYRLKKLGYGGMSAAFCLLCTLCSFGTGNVAQTGAVASFLRQAGVPPAAITAVSGFAVALAVFGGRERISSLNAKILPAASALYIAVCLAVLAANAEGIPRAFGEIFSSAFGFAPVAGGFSGAVISAAVKEGCARSVFSNEAGMGSSPLAHATSEGDPETQSAFGVFEIFFDSFAVSTLTAVCLISCRTEDISSAFSSVLGQIAPAVFGALTAVFAFAAVISWCYYAECCLFCMFGSRKAVFIIYRLAFSACAAAGAFLPADGIIAVSDILNAGMMVPNMFLLYRCRSEINQTR